MPRTPRRRRTARSSLALLALLVVAACGDDDGGGSAASTTTAPSGQEITEAGFAFRDASIPPEYHRSWTVTVTDGQAYVVVDSYGDVVGEDTATLDDGTWDQLRANVAALEGDEAVEGEDCTGGTGAQVWAMEGEVERFEMDAEVCGGDNADVVERWMAAFDPVTELVDMEALLATAE
ncbi:hypothetical protein [Actinomarinicola tropica]|uniref:Lipoprotein n=1 Tax=Actinomarinicola tropica TaxID=2789776 RepID=A0A5Q2RRR5_9ACTN|nr:hypothetical protein [Actinomarinicola tropica]QGG96590.1 hypothetical protein GH723_16595 [Actinomarinicola tropica]